jgi:hypothetical protein
LLNESDTTCTDLEDFMGNLWLKSDELKRVMSTFKEVKGLKCFQVSDSTSLNAYLRCIELAKSEES